MVGKKMSLNILKFQCKNHKAWYQQGSWLGTIHSTSFKMYFKSNIYCSAWVYTTLEGYEFILLWFGSLCNLGHAHLQFSTTNTLNIHSNRCTRWARTSPEVQLQEYFWESPTVPKASSMFPNLPDLGILLDHQLLSNYNILSQWLQRKEAFMSSFWQPVS